MGQNYSQPVFDQRSIILLGETGAGKSSFGNFLLNSNSFVTGGGMLSTTQTVEQKSCQYTQDNLNIQLHVFDLPGLNDPRKIDITHLNNMYSALKNCSKCLSTLFAIVINIASPEQQQLSTSVNEIHSFLEKVELPDFNITDNALLVFSNAQELGPTPEIQESELFQKIETCPPLYKLWTLVRFRHILVDSIRYTTDQKYWVDKMRDVIKFTRPKVRVLLLGPCANAQNDLLLMLRTKKSELGEPDELPEYNENELNEVSLEFEGCSLSFEKSLDFTSIDNIDTKDIEKSNALNQLTCLINAITETHTFTAFCVLIRMDITIKNNFINGIKALASAISEDKIDLFYNRCFFLFTHSDQPEVDKKCNAVFSNLPDMKQMRASMDDRVSVFNLKSSPEYVCNFLKQTLSYSIAMKDKCYGKQYVSNLLSTGFDLSPPRPDPTPGYRYTPSKLTMGLIALGGGGIIALAGAAAVLLTAGAATPAVAPVMLFAAHSSAVVAAPLIAAPIVAGGASVLGGTLGAIGVGANAAVASTLFYKLLASKNKEKKDEREYEYDIAGETFKYVDS